MKYRTNPLAGVIIVVLPLVFEGCGTPPTAQIDPGTPAAPPNATAQSAVAVASGFDSMTGEAVSDRTDDTGLAADGELAVASAAPAPGTVTTRLDLPECDGVLRTKFIATPNGDGSWNVTAEVRPSRVEMAVHFGIDPGSGARATLKGVATANFDASTEMPLSVHASGLRLDTRFAGSFDAGVGMYLSIGANGVVNVTSHYVAVNCVFCGISCNN